MVDLLQPLAISAIGYHHTSCLSHAYDALPLFDAVAVPPSSPAAIGRLVVQSLGSPSWLLHGNAWPSTAALEANLLRTVVSIRQAIQDTRCAALITCPAGGCSWQFAAPVIALLLFLLI